MTERQSHSIRNAFWSVMFTLVSTLMGFVIRTLLIKKIGAEYLGLSGLCQSILGTLNLAELGMDTALSFNLYKPFAEGDRQQVNALLALYQRLYKIIALVILALGLAVLPFLRGLIEGEPPAGLNIHLVFVMYLLDTVFSYLLYPPRRPLVIVSQQFSIHQKILLLNFAFLYSAQIFCLFFLENYLFFTFCFPIFSIIGSILYRLVTDRKFPEYKAEGELDKGFYAPFIKRVSGVAIARLRNASRSYIDVIFISSFLGLILEAKYNVYIMILIIPQSVIGIIISSIKGSIGNYFAVETEERKYGLFDILSLMFFWLAAFCATCLACLYQPFIKLWLGEGMLLPLSSALAAAILFFISTIASMLEMTKDITGIYWENRWTPIVEMIVNIVLDIICIRLWGVQGVLFATAFSIGIITLPSDAHVLFKHYFKKPPARYIVKYLFFTVLAAAAALATYIICSRIPGTGIPLLAARLAVCLLIPNAILAIAFARTDSFKSLLGTARQILGKS
ncbi:MAG: hypothetical protein IJU95_03355 [Treponema sp.]|nr:hypothetical protein [Treponema sp.]